MQGILFLQSVFSKLNRKNAFIAGLILISSIVMSCRKAVLPPQVQVSLGTVCSINLFEDGTQELYGEIFSFLTSIDHIFNVNDPASEMYSVNSHFKTDSGSAVEAPEFSPVLISPVFHSVLTTALDFAYATDGAFDPSIGPLVKLWGINTESAHIPAQSQIEEILPLVNYRKIRVLDSGEGKSLLMAGNMALDFGGVAKGYAADGIVEILKLRGVKRAIIDLGGNIYAYGKKAPDRDWTVAVRDPQNKDGAPALVISVADATVVTSGDYERYYEEDGRRFGHILDPKSGMPASDGIRSVTVVGRSSMNADLLSTGLFVMGMQGISRIREKAPDMDFDYIIMTDDGEIHASRNLESKLRLLNDSYVIYFD